ncbi:MAG: hypothetical protein ACE5FT_04845 [Candidatus Nanoarchaeia archaeon]
MKYKPNPKVITLIEKLCGHVGYIRSEYPQRHVSCTQCGLDNHEPEQIFVPIVQRKVLRNIPLPELSTEEMTLWIKKHLEVKNDT